MTMCVQEEGRLLTESSDTVLLTAQERQSKKTKDMEKGKTKLSLEHVIKKESRCFFCNKKGHMKKDCMKFKSWFEKIFISLLFVLNLIWYIRFIALCGLTLVLQSML